MNWEPQDWEPLDQFELGLEPLDWMRFDWKHFGSDWEHWIGDDSFICKTPPGKLGVPFHLCLDLELLKNLGT